MRGVSLLLLASVSVIALQAVPVAGQEQTLLQEGKWEVTERTDRLTRESTRLLVGDATEVDGITETVAQVAFQSDQDSAFIVSVDGAPRAKEVSWRVGESPVRRALYTLPRPGGAVVDDEQFLADLRGAPADSEIVLRIEFQDGTSRTFLLPAVGFAEAYAAFAGDAEGEAEVESNCVVAARQSLAAGAWSDEFVDSNCLAELTPAALAAIIAPSESSAPAAERPKPYPDAPTSEGSERPKPYPDAPPSGGSGDAPLTATSMDARFTEKNSTWWRWAYQVTLLNQSNETVSLSRICVQAADADGFTIDQDIQRGVVIGPGQSRQLSGFVLIDAAVAPNVEKIGIGPC